MNKAESCKSNYFDKQTPLKFAIILAFVSIYLINRSEEWFSFNIAFDSVLAILLISLLAVSIALNGIDEKFSIFYLLIFLSSLISFVFGGIFNIHWLYLIICVEIIRLNVLFVGWSLQILCGVVFIAILIQVSIFRFEDGRPVLSIGDPNYSAYYLFIFMIFAYSSGRNIITAVLIAILFLSLSRTAFVSIILFSLSCVAHRYFNLSIKLNKWFYLSLIILGPIIYSLLFIYSGIDINTNYSSDVDRLTNFADQSNVDRSLANIYFVEYIIEYPFHLFSGIEINNYTEIVFRNTPHASVYALIFNYGLFYFASVLASIICVVGLVNTRFSVSIFAAALLPWMIFLGGVLFGPQVIFLGLILNSFRAKFDA
jgi:hypothetical protein